MKIKEGQEVFIVPIGNAARYSKKAIKSKVTKVGRKWFAVDNMDGEQFSIEDGLSNGKNYSPDYHAYESAEHYDKMIELPKIKADIIDLVGNLEFNEASELLKKLQENVAQR